ncbi:MAG: SMR family transporter [Pseudomonadota bacterium]
MPVQFIYLFFAVLAETAATAALQASAQFTRLWPSVAVVVGYGLAFYFMSLTLRYMPVGIVYAIWSGLGILFIAIIGYFVFHQKLDLPAILGIALILAGILVINLFSQTASH